MANFCSAKKKKVDDMHILMLFALDGVQDASLLQPEGS